MSSAVNTGPWNKPSGTGSVMRLMKPFFMNARIPVMLAALLLVMSVRGSAEVAVTAELSRPDVSLGDMAELQVRVSGTQGANVPRELAVEGLQIRLTGQSTQVQMVNFKVSSSVLYSYVVMPLRAGTFTIPSIPVTAEGKQYRTAPVSLTVHAGGGAVPGIAAPPPQQIAPQMPGMPPRPIRNAAQAQDQVRLAFGEIQCLKRTIYAGEMVPVEIRFYFDARNQVQVRGKVDFGGEGVIAERFPDPGESREERDGAIYNVLTFRTLLSAVKPGTINLSPAKIDCQIQLPGALPPGFDDPVFQQLLGGQSPFNQTKDIAVKTEPLRLEVLPLPKEGRPASFAGAVGQFDLDAVVQNPRPAPGDPVTLTVKIGGKGNFKGMGAPVLTGSDGWRSYPPTDKFDATDVLSYTGVKAFDFTLIAQEPRQSTPAAEFSYFDPVTAKYVTLASKPLPVDASPGSPVNQAALPAGPAPGATASPAAGNGSAAPREGEPFTGMTLHPWSTPSHRLEFRAATLAMIVAAAALATFLYLRDLNARGGSAASRRRRRIAELWSSLDAGTLDAASTYDAAVEYAGLAAAPSAKRDEVMARLTERRDVFKYGSGGSVALPASERKQLLQTLRALTDKSS